MQLRIVLILFSLFFSTSALAYVPSVDYVLGEWMRKIRKVKTLHVKQVTTVFSDSLPEGQVKVEEEIWIQRPLRYRKRSKYPNGLVNDLVLPGKSVRVTPKGTQRRPPLELLGPLGVVWAAGSKSRLLSLLAQWKIPSESTRWTQEAGHVSYEMGLPGGQRLRFEKNRWVPVGAFLGNTEYRFETSPTKGFPTPFPEVVEVRRNGELVLRSETQSVRVGIPLKKSIFSLESLRRKAKTK